MGLEAHSIFFNTYVPNSILGITNHFSGTLYRHFCLRKINVPINHLNHLSVVTRISVSTLGFFCRGLIGEADFSCPNIHILNPPSTALRYSPRPQLSTFDGESHHFKLMFSVSNNYNPSPEDSLNIHNQHRNG